MPHRGSCSECRGKARGESNGPAIRQKVGDFCPRCRRDYRHCGYQQMEQVACKPPTANHSSASLGSRTDDEGTHTDATAPNRILHCPGSINHRCIRARHGIEPVTCPDRRGLRALNRQKSWSRRSYSFCNVSHQMIHPAIRSPNRQSKRERRG
jgi:hypothetical protein